ncbi:MAG: hypothetical protein Q8L12_02895, partial [Methylibium sp.]|nr:hypothetical protein [Methylibium sp.]
MKLKKLAAALALVATAPAFASIALPNTGNGELFAVVYDSVDQASYTLDLGVFIDNFNGNGSYSYTLGGANWNGFVGAAGTDNLQFAVIGGDSTGQSVANPSRLFTTVNAATTALTQQQLTNAASNTTVYANNQVTVSANTTHAGDATVNGSSWDVVGNNAYFLAQSMNTFNTVTAGAAWGNNNAAGTSAAFRSFSKVSTGGGTQALQTTYDGVWTLGQQQGNWTLSYSVAAVPEPGSLALMLAGLGAV